MDRKQAGVTDIVAKLATEDSELKQAAIRLQEKRSGGEQSKPQEPSKRAAGPRLVSPPKKIESKSSSNKSKELVTRQRTKQPAIETKWSRPTAVLNTRIPPEIDQLLDDHVAKKKRQWKLERQQGKKPTKQTVVQAALIAFFLPKKTQSK